MAFGDRRDEVRLVELLILAKSVTTDACVSKCKAAIGKAASSTQPGAAWKVEIEVKRTFIHLEIPSSLHSGHSTSANPATH